MFEILGVDERAPYLPKNLNLKGFVFRKVKRIPVCKIRAQKRKLLINFQRFKKLAYSITIKLKSLTLCLIESKY